jgi:hypothetical protein
VIKSKEFSIDHSIEFEIEEHAHDLYYPLSNSIVHTPILEIRVSKDLLDIDYHEEEIATILKHQTNEGQRKSRI